jgi:hypothetical protein
MRHLRIPEDDPRRDRDPREPIQPPADEEPEDPLGERPIDEPEDSPSHGEPARRDPGAHRPIRLAHEDASW